eukprot:gene13617-13743_t
METAGKENLPGRCPNCRAEYDKEKITMAALDPSVVEMEQQRKKETKKKGQMAQQHRPPRSLGQVRVVQRTLVYCVGLPMNVCREEVLSERHYFGGFGRIKKISVNRSTPFSQVQKNGPSGSAYVTYYRAEDALRCIEAIDGTVWDGKTIKACFGTTKYCNAFLKGVPCNNTDCLYLHEIGRSTFFDLVHPTNTMEASAHAHAAIKAANNSNGSGSSCSTDTGGALTSLMSVTSGVGGAVQGAVVAGSTAAGPAVAGVMPAKTQPIAISGGRISSSNPWGGSGTGDSAATSPAPAAAGQWGSTPKLTPTALRSQLADMEWPSLATAQDGGSPVPAGPAAKSPPPGFAGAGAGAAGKGPPPGFSGQVKPVQQRLPPPGFEPSLIALARASSSSNVSQLGPGASSSTRSSSPGGGGHSDAAAAVFALGDQGLRQLAPEGPTGRPAVPSMSHTAFDINAFFDGPVVGGGPGALFDVAGGLLAPGRVMMGPGLGGGGGAAAHAAISPVPLSARKQSRWGFAQQASPAAAAAPAASSSPFPGPAAVPQQLPVAPPPPGFNASFAPGGSPGGLQGSLSFANQTQQATSFFKSLLPDKSPGGVVLGALAGCQEHQVLHVLRWRDQAADAEQDWVGWQGTPA